MMLFNRLTLISSTKLASLDFSVAPSAMAHVFQRIRVVRSTKSITQRSR